MTVVYLKDWQQRHRKTSGKATQPLPIEPAHLPPVAPPPMQAPDVLEALQERHRMRQNLGGLAVVVVIVFVGGWLINQIQTQSRIQACFDYGHRNCMPLNIGHIARQDVR